MRKMKKAAMGLLLVVMLLLTGCVQTCATPLCNNDSQRGRDLCERCRGIFDDIQDIENLFRR